MGNKVLKVSGNVVKTPQMFCADVLLVKYFLCCGVNEEITI